MALIETEKPTRESGNPSRPAMGGCQEPHGYHSAEIKAAAPIDVVITPIITLGLPFVGSIIQGNKTALDAARSLQPQVMLATAAGGDVEFDGLLISLLKTEGTIEELRESLAKNNLSTQVIDPTPGEPMKVLA